MQETDLSNHVSDRRAARNRVGPIVILLFVPVLFFSGIPGVHGGGFGTRAALVMSLLSAPVGLLTVIWGREIVAKDRMNERVVLERWMEW